jgi:hypothetical protein
MLGLRSDSIQRAFDIVVVAGFALISALSGCASPMASTSTGRVPAVSTGSDQERCEGSNGVWRNGTCVTMGGGGGY